MASLGLPVVVPMSLGLLMFLRSIIAEPNIFNLYMLTPSFHIDNSRSWFLLNRQMETPYVSANVEISLGVSLTILVAWVFCLTGLAVILFQRQDIT